MSKLTNTESETIRNLIEVGGGRCLESFQPSETTHLITEIPEGQKYSAATSHDIPVVDPKWLFKICLSTIENSKITWREVEMGSFEFIPKRRLPVPKNRRSSMMPPEEPSSSRKSTSARKSVANRKSIGDFDIGTLLSIHSIKIGPFFRFEKK